MARILIASTPLLGHVSPMLLAASSLQKGGHEVLFLSGEVFRAKIEQAGIPFTSLEGYANYDWRNLPSLFTPQEASAEGIEGHIIHLKRLFADCITDQFHSLEASLQHHRADLILVDVLYMGILPLLLRGGARPPVVSLGVIAPIWSDSGASPFLGADGSPQGQERNRQDWLRFDAAVLPGTSYIDQILAGLGVAVQGGFRMFDTMYRLPDRLLQLCVEEFEYPLVESRANLRFVGPILPKQMNEAPSHEWLRDVDAATPLVFVTQGTLANTDFDQLINPSITALANEPVKVVVTAGDGDASRIANAQNAVVASYIPYEVILPRTTVFLTNGGYNGVQHALSFGVPVVAAGATEDKPYVTARVEWSGAGIDLKTGTPSPEEIHTAVRKAIVRADFRDRARALGSIIRASDALASIHEEVNKLLAASTTKPGTLAPRQRGLNYSLVTCILLAIPFALQLGIGCTRAASSSPKQLERQTADLGTSHPTHVSTLAVEGKAPKLEATEWIGTPPLKAEDLKGKVVLVDFWTYSCINCIRVTPYLNAWADKYRDKGFIVLGVHSPEFSFEKGPENIRDEIKRFRLAYPVAVDSEYKIWNAFENHSWPAYYLVDAQGRIRYHQFGEGDYSKAEAAIQDLLAEATTGVEEHTFVNPEASGAQAAPNAGGVGSPETYLGLNQSTGFASPEGVQKNRNSAYSTPQLVRNRWALSGTWNIAADQVRLGEAEGTITYRFLARDLHLVMATSEDGKPVRFQVTLDGKPPREDHGVDIDGDGNGVVYGARLYQLVRQKGPVRERTFQIRFKDAGVRAFVFTFG